MKIPLLLLDKVAYPYIAVCQQALHTKNHFFVCNNAEQNIVMKLLSRFWYGRKTYNL